MFQELKVGFGHYMGRFFDQLVPTTKPMAEYCRRPFKYAVMLAPARMIDMAEDLLASICAPTFKRTSAPTRARTTCP